ncbi:MAG: GntR family transcriptional regulator [Mycobacteriales bacterium]
MQSYEMDAAIQASDAGRRLAHRQPLTTDVYEVVIDMLMNHSLGPGMRLNIDSLARTLGVSPTPVREALARVESEGLIIKAPQRGYTVAPLIGLEQLHELIEMRLLIEPPVAAKAASLASTADASELRAFARTGGAGEDNAIAANRLDMMYDAHFHDMVASIGGNQLIRETLSRLRSHLHMYRLYHHAGQAAVTKPEHLAIVKAIAKRDSDGAHAAMEAHLTNALDRLDVVFASSQNPDVAQ